MATRTLPGPAPSPVAPVAEDRAVVRAERLTKRFGDVPGAGRYTPIAAAALTADPADYLLSPLGGGLLLIAYAAVFVAAGALLVARRDVT